MEEVSRNQELAGESSEWEGGRSLAPESPAAPSVRKFSGLLLLCRSPVTPELPVLSKVLGGCILKEVGCHTFSQGCGSVVQMFFAHIPLAKCVIPGPSSNSRRGKTSASYS